MREEKLRVLSGRTVLLFPDADAYAEWKQRAESMYFCISFEQVKIGFIESLAQLLNVYIPKDITVEYSDDNSSWKTYQATTKLERHAGYNVLRFYSDQNSVTASCLLYTSNGW